MAAMGNVSQSMFRHMAMLFALQATLALRPTAMLSWPISQSTRPVVGGSALIATKTTACVPRPMC
jgi:hypothetical protein